jgi:LPXTG-motif cell wall-anchored protein
MKTEPVEETKAEVDEAQPIPEPAPVAARTPAPELALAAEPTLASAELPQTASSFSLVGLIGLLSLGAGAAVSFITKHEVG